MLKKLKRPGRRIFTALGIVMMLAAGCIGFTGCKADAEENTRLEDLEFTVAAENEVPAQLKELISQKREKAFKLTYADGQDMYIVIGEGPQKGGGYSVAVRELYLTENTVVIRTELMGPEKGETSGSDLSYPVLIVKTQYREEPVVFQ
ncbi:MAG: protease complex subunit PrcB family protein [Lachnospiraceae bacterium]|nr:protease complex subunit PrcB family protein [Lachnospiraceae bacterium]